MTPAATHLPACFAAFPGAVLHLSPDGMVVDSNGCLERELGVSIVGRPFAAIVDADSSGEKWKRVLRDAQGPESHPRCELVLAHGETLLEPRRFSVLWDAESSVVWMVEHPTDPRMTGVRQEVTEVNSELASAQRDLVRERGRLVQSLADTVRSNRALDEFAHAISHDLKAPLRSVANYARWIEEDLAGVLTGETRAHMELLRSQVDRMRSMINGVLEYARSGRDRLAPETVDTEALVREVIALLDPPSSVTVEVAPAGLPTFSTELAPLRQVLLNLVGNAIKHARRPDVHVEVSATDVGNAYDFAVRDNGPGIPPLAQDKIWALFHRLNPHENAGTGGDIEGTGIGLAIVRQLVELQGGRAWVESDVGNGSTFHFVWPKQVESQGGDRAERAGTSLNA